MSRDFIRAELKDLEDRLRQRRNAEPPADLRIRVLRAVAAELAKPAESSGLTRWGAEWWAAVAAAVLLVANLSMVSASQSAFSIRPAGDPAQQMAREMQVIGQLEAQQEGILK
jgi:hypothetical protein